MSEQQQRIVVLTEHELESLIERAIKKAGEFVSDPDNGLMNIRQAASFLSISQGKLYTLVQNKEVPHRKIGKRILFSKNELLKWQPV